MSINILNKSIPVLLAGFILTGCGGVGPLAKPTPEAFNFEQVAKDPSKEVKQNLKVEVFGDGIKNTKKFVIGAFQVRVRTDLTGEYKEARRLGFTGIQKLKSQAKLGGGNDALFQKVTDTLYKEFVANLKQHGIETVNLSAIKKYPEYQGMGSNLTTGGKWMLKDDFASGHAVPLVEASISDDYAEDDLQGYGGTITSVLFGKIPDDNYQIFYPAAAPGLNYVRNVVTLFTPTDYPVGDDIVLKSQLPQPLLDAAAHDNIGVITAAFEVELVKFKRERTETQSAISWEISGGAPMVRTKLTALKMLPPGTQMGSFFNAANFTNGLRITTKHRGIKHNGLIRSMFDGDVFGPHWVEVDDGAVTLTEQDGLSIISPVAGKFPAAFKKATDGNQQMIMYAIDHQADF